MLNHPSSTLGTNAQSSHPIIKSMLAARSQRRAWQTLLAQTTHAQIKKDCIALRNTAAGIAICNQQDPAVNLKQEKGNSALPFMENSCTAKHQQQETYK